MPLPAVSSNLAAVETDEQALHCAFIWAPLCSTAEPQSWPGRGLSSLGIGEFALQSLTSQADSFLSTRKVKLSQHMRFSTALSHKS